MYKTAKEIMSVLLLWHKKEDKCSFCDKVNEIICRELVEDEKLMED